MDIVEELSVGISSWIAKAPTRNRGVLQRRTRIAEATLRRIHEKNQQSVSLEIAIELAYELYETDEAISFLKRHFPVAGRWQEKLYAKKDDVVTFGEYLQDPVLFKIVLLCDTLSGATAEEIKEELGADGVRQLSKLVELGFIVHNKGVHKCANEDVVHLSAPHVHFAMLTNMIKIYEPENANVRAACRERVWWQGLNSAAVERLAVKLADFEDTLAEILKDPNSRGDIPWYFGMIQNVLRSKLL